MNLKLLVTCTLTAKSENASNLWKDLMKNHAPARPVTHMNWQSCCMCPSEDDNTILLNMSINYHASSFWVPLWLRFMSGICTTFPPHPPKEASILCPQQHLSQIPYPATHANFRGYPWRNQCGASWQRRSWWLTQRIAWTRWSCGACLGKEGGKKRRKGDNGARQKAEQQRVISAQQKVISSLQKINPCMELYHMELISCPVTLPKRKNISVTHFLPKVCCQWNIQSNRYAEYVQQ